MAHALRAGCVGTSMRPAARLAWIAVGTMHALGCARTVTADVDAGQAPSGAPESRVPAVAGGAADNPQPPGTVGGSAVPGGLPEALSLACGPVRCTQAAPEQMLRPLTFAEACCVDPSKGVCGTISQSTHRCEPPPEPAPKCPRALNAPGCCAGQNLCGADLSVLGMGCVELAKLKASVPAALLNLPGPAHCDGTPLLAGAIDGDAGR